MLLEDGIVVTLVGCGLAGAGVGFRGAWTAALLTGNKGVSIRENSSSSVDMICASFWMYVWYFKIKLTSKKGMQNYWKIIQAVQMKMK